ncbi:hypothetical protein BH20CHL3_BH20CHL3_09590 [soil metagenome]
MYGTDIYLDQTSSTTDLASAFAQVLGVSTKRVVVMDQEDYEQLGSTWVNPKIAMVLRTASLRGDFPVALEIRLREDTPDLRTLLSGAARLLGASILTDELVVNPLFTSDWLMFTPDGDVIVIEADEEEFAADEPAIVLTPESRRVYEARQRPAERLATTASS